MIDFIYVMVLLVVGALCAQQWTASFKTRRTFMELSRADLLEIKAELGEVKGDLREVKGDLREVKGDLREIMNKLDLHK
jgi:hypothetical protein